MAEPPKRPARPSQPVRSPSTGPTTGRPSQMDRAMALRDAVAQAVESEKNFKQKTIGKHGRGRLIALAVLLGATLGFSAYSWIARPEFIWGPRIEPLSDVEADANMRTALFFLGMRLDAYREEQGFYPASLDAIGEPLPGIAYELVSDSVFELRATVNRKQVLFRSDMTAKEYLGNSKDIISLRTKRR